MTEIAPPNEPTPDVVPPRDAKVKQLDKEAADARKEFERVQPTQPPGDVEEV